MASQEGKTNSQISVGKDKKVARSRSFHFRYMELCRAKNYPPMSELRVKNNSNYILDFQCDKLNVTDWMLIMQSLATDQILKTLALRQRKNHGCVVANIDTESKAKLYKEKPPIYSHFIFSGTVDAIASCIQYSKAITILHLEGLPLSDKYLPKICKALSDNTSIKELSFKRSKLGDTGVQAVSNTLKYLNIEVLNLNETDMTAKGAQAIADMLKFQKINHYSEGWKRSLRYREVDPDSIGGIRLLNLSNNPGIGDDGLQTIVEVLKEDLWIKVLDMENCGITDLGANYILDCLELNTTITEFNVKNNSALGIFLLRNITTALGHDEDDTKVNGLCLDEDLTKWPSSQLRMKIKELEASVQFEQTMRTKAEQLNIDLCDKLAKMEHEMRMLQKEIAKSAVELFKESQRKSKLDSANNVKHNSSPVTSAKQASVEDNASSEAAFIAEECSASETGSISDASDSDAEEISQSATLCPAEGASTFQTDYSFTTEDDFSTTSSSSPMLRKLSLRRVQSAVQYADMRQPYKNQHLRPISKSDHGSSNRKDYNLENVRAEVVAGDSARGKGKPEVPPFNRDDFTSSGILSDFEESEEDPGTLRQQQNSDNEEDFDLNSPRALFHGLIKKT